LPEHLQQENYIIGLSQSCLGFFRFHTCGAVANEDSRITPVAHPDCPIIPAEDAGVSVEAGEEKIDFGTAMVYL